MRFVLDVLPAAIADIVEAARWYGDQREGLGHDFTFAEVNNQWSVVPQSQFGFLLSAFDLIPVSFLLSTFCF